MIVTATSQIELCTIGGDECDPLIGWRKLTDAREGYASAGCGGLEGS